MRRKYYNDYRTYYTPSKPILTDDGITAKTRRGEFGKTWWGQTFTQILEQFGWSNRLKRGKAYARKGQVLNFSILPGKIVGKVQGSTRTPYNVSITLKTFSNSEWITIVQELSNQAIYSAELLAGEIPLEILDLLADKGFLLLPQSRKDLKMYCSCPDSAIPCKHIAAVYYLVAEKFDEDPFILFKLRGITKEKLLESIRAKRKKVINKIKTLNSSENMLKKEWTLNKLEITNYWYNNSENNAINVKNENLNVQKNILNRFLLSKSNLSQDSNIDDLLIIMDNKFQLLLRKIFFK